VSRSKLRKIARYDSCPLFDSNDLIGWNVGQLLHQSARPCDFERVDLASHSQAEMNTWIARRHVTHAAFCLLELHHSLRRQLEGRSNAVAIRFRPNQQNGKPVVCI